VCISCAGIHRSLGAHISKVRSVDLDVLESSMLDTLANVGNRRANEVYEFNRAEVAKFKPNPTDDYHKKKKFIVLKYKSRAFANPAVLPPLPSSAEDDTTEGTESSNESVTYEGWLTKQGNNYKAWRLRWFVLKDGTLSYFRTRGAAEPAGRIDLSIAQVKVSSLPRPNTLELVTPRRVYYLQADNSSDFFVWNEVLKKAIQQSSKIAHSISNNNAATSSKELMLKGGNADYIGFLIKRGLQMKTWKKRYFVLKDNKLAYYVKPGETTPKGSISLCSAEFRIASDETRAKIVVPAVFNNMPLFELITPNRTYYILAETMDELNGWRTAIENAIRKYSTPPAT
jgi:hypothetical protein